MTYRAPVADMLFTMAYAAGPEGLADEEMAAAVLQEAATIAEDVLAPLDKIGDRDGVTLTEAGVKTAQGWPEAYQAWISGGWNGVSAPEDAGGMGLPLLLNAACLEIWSGANLAFALAGLLTAGAIEALHRHGSDDLKRIFLPKLVSGEWPGTMNLTEPQAGSDLGALRCQAGRTGDGTYRIKGQKIFITYGDHDLTENILHLVLARLPDAPAGTRGISLFLVPKILVGRDGALGSRNDLRCVGIEKKLGMHGAPTCTMAFGDAEGATGYLVGEEHKGLACMFTMMNNARLAVGLEGVAAAEHASQKAIAFAQSRQQGRRDPRDAEMTAIIRHPDVARMLMMMKASTAAARCLCYLTAAALDRAKSGSDEASRRVNADRAALLTPVAKAFSTDMANEIASLGIQVHGGTGYIEETGATQIMRDIRIAAIYEGTNGIQAIDLATRKIPMREGAVLADEIQDMRRSIDRLQRSNVSGFGRAGEQLSATIDALQRTSALMLSRMAGDSAQVLASATPYLRLFGLARSGASLIDLALMSETQPMVGSTRTAMHWVVLARFFAEFQLPESAGLEAVITHGSAVLADNPDTWFDAL